VVAADDDDRRLRQAFPEPAELVEGVQDRGIRGSHRVKQVARHQHHVGSLRHHVVHRAPEGLSYVGFPLVDPLRRLPMVLPKAEMDIREVGNPHRTRPPPKLAPITSAPGAGYSR